MYRKRSMDLLGLQSIAKFFKLHASKSVQKSVKLLLTTQHADEDGTLAKD